MHHSRNRFMVAVIIGMMLGGAALAASDYRISGPYQCQNLTVFIVHSDLEADFSNVLTLNEALEKGYITVFETGQVGELAIENYSAYPVYIQSGMIVKGGKQDRVLRYDIIIQAKSGRVPLPSFCVEQGRWTPREKESAERFSSAAKLVPHREIKIAAKAAESQEQVWSSVADLGKAIKTKVHGEADAGGYHSSSLQIMQEDEIVRSRVEEYLDFFRGKIRLRDDAVGLVFAVNGKLSCADLYQSPLLFAKMYPQLLEAAATEATTEFVPKKKVPTVTSADVFRWMEESEHGNFFRKSINRTMELRIKETDDCVVFETYPNLKTSIWIHKNILAR